ncbi:MAG: hypothetical protein ACLTJG_02230 [[Clostridium] innocuum]
MTALRQLKGLHCALHQSLQSDRKHLADGAKHIAGNKCERPVTGKVNKEKLPNLYDYK